MSEKFHEFAAAVEARFSAISSGELYQVEATDLFERYLAAFPEGTNELFRVRTEHDCSCCKNFVRNIGHVVALDNGSKMTVWDVDVPYPYNAVAEAMANYVRGQPIKSVWRTKEHKYGAPYTLELRNSEDAFRWHHFWCEVPAKNRTDVPEQKRGEINTAFSVLKRGLEELTTMALVTVQDLISDNAIYRGAEFKSALLRFMDLHARYHSLPTDQREAFIWANVSNRNALFRNTVIGTLAIDLSEGVETNKAVRSFETKVAPLHYKRPTAVVTKRMVEDAVTQLQGLGLESAIERRFARLEDVSVNNVLWVDNSVAPQMKDGLLGKLLAEIKPGEVNIKNAEEVSVDDFLSRVLPQASTVDLLVQNKHQSQFMSLTAPVHPDAGQLFKWDNGFAWSYDGDAADSIKARVKRAGGKIDADLRVSLAWFNRDDLDLHVREPNGSHIYYGSKGPHGRGGGQLDVDMNVVNLVRDPVENVVWSGRIADGAYSISVNQFTRRESVDVGFDLEVEYGEGQISQFRYDKAVVGTISSLVLIVKDGALVKIEASNVLSSGSAQQDKWGIKTETLVPVDTLMASPNHWDGQETGNKHWFFILKGCRNPEPARGIYNEFLRPSLEKHRKVFELLGTKSKCPVVPEQLSGVGFSSTRSDIATVVVKGKSINRAFNIKF